LTNVSERKTFVFYESLSVKEDPVIQPLVASAQWWSVMKQVDACSPVKKILLDVSSPFP